MSEEFNLSEKIEDASYYTRSKEVLLIKDVKEFIKRLKETIEEGVNRNDILPLDWCFDRIDKLAGNKLTKNKNE